MKKLYTLRLALSASFAIMLLGGIVVSCSKDDIEDAGKAADEGEYSFVADGINYSVNGDGETVTVTYKSGEGVGFDGNDYSGSIVIPQYVSHDDMTYSVTGIGNNAFRYCTSLTSIEIPDGVRSIGDFAFYGCSSLESVQWAAGLEIIGNSAFSGCYSLTAIELPKEVKTIGDYAFYWCYSASNAVLSGSLEYMGTKVFGNCYSLTMVACWAENPPRLGDSVFDGVPTNRASLWVLSSAFDAYKDASQWKSFSTIYYPSGNEEGAENADNEDASTTPSTESEGSH